MEKRSVIALLRIPLPLRVCTRMRVFYSSFISTGAVCQPLFTTSVQAKGSGPEFTVVQIRNKGTAKADGDTKHAGYLAARSERQMTKTKNIVLFINNVKSKKKTDRWINVSRTSKLKASSPS